MSMDFGLYPLRDDINTASRVTTFFCAKSGELHPAGVSGSLPHNRSSAVNGTPSPLTAQSTSARSMMVEGDDEYLRADVVKGVDVEEGALQA
mgnify:CR=1 FL=1